jgi:glycosyltransferase-like protein
MRARVALVTYSTRPRGGVVHTLELAEALQRAGEPVHIVALGDPDVGFFRSTTVPHTIIPAPPHEGTLEERVFRSLDTLAEGLAALADRFQILHTQDCIAARAACRVRDSGAPVTVVRTVHHVDDFTTEALIDCQRRAIHEPDHLIVVSDYWRQVLAADYGVTADVILNGVNADSLVPPSHLNRSVIRSRIGADGRFLFLTVGGIEPRKGTLEMIEAMAKSRDRQTRPPVLAIIGGHSFQDHNPYRERVLERVVQLELSLETDVVQLGTVSDQQLVEWYHSADAFLFPSIKEGWGLVAMEALATGLPLIATDIPVFREYLTDRHDALLVPPGDPSSLADAMLEIMDDPRLRTRLVAAGRQTVSAYTWSEAARRHVALYRSELSDDPPRRRSS